MAWLLRMRRTTKPLTISDLHIQKLHPNTKRLFPERFGLGEFRNTFLQICGPAFISAFPASVSANCWKYLRYLAERFFARVSHSETSA